MRKQYDLERLRVTRRGAVARPTTKVHMTIRLDLAVLAWLVEEAVRRGLPYQALINNTLAAAMLRSEARSPRSTARGTGSRARPLAAAICPARHTGTELARPRAERLQAEIRADLEAVDAYAAKHGSFAEMVREHNGRKDE